MILGDRGGNVAELSDETLMAFADNALANAERAKVEAILALRPDLMEKVRRFERTGAPIGRAFDELGPVPAAMVEHVRRLANSSSSATVADLSVARQLRADAGSKPKFGMASRGRQMSWQAMAMAASVCLAIGTGAGWTARSTVGPTQAMEPTAALVQIALERVAGGSEIVLTNGAAGSVRVKPAVTFLDKEHRYCREYQMTGDALAPAAGVACRSRGGAWQVVTQANVDPSMRPAEGKKDEISVGAMIEKIIDGDYLAPDFEAQLIARHWQR